MVLENRSSAQVHPTGAGVTGPEKGETVSPLSTPHGRGGYRVFNSETISPLKVHPTGAGKNGIKMACFTRNSKPHRRGDQGKKSIFTRKTTSTTSTI